VPKDAKELRLEVDENNLGVEWKSQAALMLDYGIQLADAMQEEDEARANLDVVRAMLDRDIRANPDSFGCGKITETVVASTIILDGKYKDAEQRRADASHAVRILKAVVEALSHRKSTLQGMTELHKMEYYADPRSPDQPPELKAAAKAGPPTKVIPGRKVRRGREE